MKNDIKKDSYKFVLKIGLGVIVILLLGGMFDFFPFSFSSELVLGEILFCTVVICIVVAICAVYIISKLKK